MRWIKRGRLSTSSSMWSSFLSLCFSIFFSSILSFLIESRDAVGVFSIWLTSRCKTLNELGGKTARAKLPAYLSFSLTSPYSNYVSTQCLALYFYREMLWRCRCCLVGAHQDLEIYTMRPDFQGTYYGICITMSSSTLCYLAEKLPWTIIVSNSLWLLNSFVILSWEMTLHPPWNDRAL